MNKQQSGPVDAVESPLQRRRDCRASLAQTMAESVSPSPTLMPWLPPATQGLLKLPGVAGIYVCVLGHENSPWLKVILPEPSPEIERQIPCGCRVVTQIFREIRPLRP